jgi:pyruvate,orthophosphate dikinase
MNIAEGILTARGGVTSHAAVVAREWGNVVFSAGSININYKTRIMTIGGKSIQKENGFL